MAREHPVILALGYSEAAMFLRGEEGRRVEAIISIHGKQEFGVEAAAPFRLDLEFDDVTGGDPTDQVSMYQARMRRLADLENGLDRHAPRKEDAAAIIRFAESIKEVRGIVLCHCAGGVSRSPATALLCLAAWKGTGHEKQCMDEVMRMRACATPHEDLVRFGDEILGCGGRLIEAVSSYGNRGRPDEFLFN